MFKFIYGIACSSLILLAISKDHQLMQHSLFLLTEYLIIAPEKSRKKVLRLYRRQLRLCFIITGKWVY